MVVKFNVDSGANIHSCKTVTFDLSNPKDVKAFGYTEKEWLALTDEEKDEELDLWAQNYLSIYYEED